MFIRPSWNRVVAVSAPWVTTHQSLHGQISAFEWTMFPNRLQSIIRTGWVESARWTKEWGDGNLVKPNASDQQLTDDFAQCS